MTEPGADMEQVSSVKVTVTVSPPDSPMLPRQRSNTVPSKPTTLSLLNVPGLDDNLPVTTMRRRARSNPDCMQKERKRREYAARRPGTPPPASSLRTFSESLNESFKNISLPTVSESATEPTEEQESFTCDDVFPVIQSSPTRTRVSVNGKFNLSPKHRRTCRPNPPSTVLDDDLFTDPQDGHSTQHVIKETIMEV